MKVNADYHNHTKYSGDGFGKIEEKAISAEKKGLSQIAITDHGFAHRINGISRQDLKEMRKEVDRINQKYKVDVLLGVEGNLIGRDGTTDITKDDEKILDIVLVGFHVFGKPKDMKERFKFFYMNFLAKLFFYTKKRIDINTNAYINAIKKSNIDIITHPGHAMKVDAVKLAKACVKHDVMLELNGKRIQYKRSTFQDVIKTGVKFVINSDSHTNKGIGECSHGINFAKKYNIPEEQIFNIGEFKNPKFKLGDN